jgi:hypothetical protein
MAKVTFVFTGIGMGYIKDDRWKIIFPFENYTFTLPGFRENCHKVLFEYAGEYIRLSKPQTEITVEVNGSKPTSMTRTGTDYEQILNLTKQTAHSNLVMNSEWRKNGVLMTIPNAVMSMQDPMKSRYQLLEGNTVVDNLDYFAFSAKAVIELEEEGWVKVSVNNNETDFPKTFYGNKGDHMIIINNNCHSNPVFATGDLKMLYESIVNDPTGKRLTVKRHPDHQNLYENTAVTIDDLPDDKSLKEMLLLDLLNHNPLPRALGGLPCYFTVADADKVDGLS